MLSPTEKDILRTLFRSSSSLEFATLFYRIKRPSTEISKSILNLKIKGFILINQNDVSLNKDGLQYIHANRKLIFSSKPWREVPDYMMGKTIAPNEPYLPKIPDIRTGVAFLK